MKLNRLLTPMAVSIFDDDPPTPKELIKQDDYEYNIPMEVYLLSAIKELCSHD